MLSDLLGKNADLCFSVLPIAWMCCLLAANTAVKGTAHRHTMNTWVVGLSGVLLVKSGADVVNSLYEPLYLAAILSTFLCVLYGYFGWRCYKDDNWFRDQFDKLKSCLKNLGRRIVKALTPSPSPSAA